MPSFSDPPRTRRQTNTSIIIDDDQVEEALRHLSTDEVAVARGEQVFREAMLKHLKALVASLSQAGSAAAKDREAEASPRYVEAIEAYRDATVAYEAAKARREHAVYVIEVWRSQQATRRSATA